MEGARLDTYDGPWVFWKNNFPESWRIYGEPILFDAPNIEFLGSTLGELVGLVFYPEEGTFYFPDYLHVGAYRPTSPQRVEALFKKVVRDSMEEASKSLKEGSRTLFFASGVVREGAEKILAVETSFFEGENGHKRMVNGTIVEPVQPPSVELFAESKVGRKKGQILTAPEAYSRYFDFCSENGLLPVKKTIFRERFAYEVRRRWQIGLRNDLKSDGFIRQGWNELAIL